MAAANPAKVREMTDLMFGEFAKYQVLPLDASVATRLVVPRPSLVAGRKVFTYSGEPVSGIPDGTAPNVLNTSYTITADIDVPQGGAEGMIVTEGGRFGGYGMYLLKGKPVFLWNLLDLKRIRWEGTEALAPGKHTIEYDFKYDGLGFVDTGVQQPQRHWSSRRRKAEGGRESGLDPDAGAHRAVWSYRGMRPSTSGPIPARRWMTGTIRSRSSSPARSTS